jgi:hypothetical protein
LWIFRKPGKITQAVDLARSEINKTIAARDAATKQSATYRKWADDLFKQAKQIVDMAKPARD